MNKLHHHELKDKMMSESEDDEVAAPDDDKPKRVVARKAGAGDAAAASMKTCQADNCCADLTDAKPYHRRHKVCEHHAKAQATVVAGIRQRFCQQCSRFHELQEFDDAKRSCRRRLAGHNERRRKNLAADGGSQAEGGRMKGGNTAASAQLVCGQVDDRERSQMQQAVQENASYKHFHVR